MPAEPIQIPVRGAPVDWVSGLWNVPEPSESGTDWVALLAHGAGVGMHAPFMTGIAEGLANSGIPVLRFQYAYAERMEREGKRRPPDKRPILEAVHTRAMETIRERFPDARLLLAGKSMGARMSSYLAAEGADAAALCYLGYPLHPAGKPDRLRTDQFPAIAQPTLFLQGTRDALCDLELLKPALETYGGKVSLEIIDGADHGFHVLKSSGTTDEEVLAGLVERTQQWVSGL